MIPLASVVAIIGIVISLYTFYVKIRAEKKGYKALCDISDRVSCTKVVTSSYGSLLFIPNSVVGLCYYLLYILLFFWQWNMVLFWMSFVAVIASVLLLYFSLFKLKNICIMCFTTMVLNFILFFISYSLL